MSADATVTTAPTARVRRLVVACLLIVGVLPLLSLTRASAATDLFPDLETLPPRDLRFATVWINNTQHRVLQFSNTVLNTGAGRLDVLGNIDASTRNGPANQRVYDDAGNYTQYRAGSFTWHDIHSHFHYDNWGSYQLWTKADYDKWLSTGRSQGQAKKVGTKTTSCILDEEFVAELPRAPYPGQYGAAGCALQSDNTLHEGLSPGWGDTYDWYRDEQWIDLDNTPLTDGEYVLRSVTDPLNILYESPGRGDSAREGQVDNEGVTPFTVSGGRILDATAPTGTITANSTAGSTSNPNVDIRALGRDDVSGVDSFRLSNNGTTWRTFAYTPNSSSPTSVSWNLTDAAYGGTTTGGVKTVYAQFHDVSGKWGSTVQDTIMYSGGTASPPPSQPPPSPPAGGYAGAVAADGPVSYWRLGETSGSTAADAVGTNAGSYLGSPLLAQPSLVPSETNGSVRFNGAGNAVRIPDVSGLRLGSPLSLEAWIRPVALPGSGGWASIVTKAESYSLQFNGSQLEMTVIQNGTRNRVKAPVGAIAAGQTYHVVGSYDGTTSRLYVNGGMVASTALSGPAAQTSNPVVIGSWSGSEEFFNGFIDDLAIYGKALSATQVQNHRTAGTGGTAPSTNTVFASVTGTGAGSVRSTPAGISCPGTCSAQFPAGSSVTLTATAAAGSTFAGWTAGACAGSTPSCTFNATAATSATASFTGSASPSSSPSPSASPPASPPPASSYAAAVRADGPRAHWRLGEQSGTTAADVVGSHPGSYAGAPALGQGSLLSTDTNPALGLDGADDHVRIPHAAPLQLGQTLTLEAWIRPDALPASGGWATVMNKVESYALQFAGNQLEMTIVQSGVRKRLRAPAGAVAVGRTSHVVGTYDGTTQRLFVDGMQVASTPLTGPAAATTNALFIGSWDGVGERFRGRVDEVAVYGTPISAARVQAHHAAGTA